MTTTHTPGPWAYRKAPADCPRRHRQSKGAGMKYMGHRLTVRRYSRNIDHERTRGAPYCMVSGPAVLGEYVPVQGGPFAALLGACRWVSQRVKGRSR